MKRYVTFFTWTFALLAPLGLGAQGLVHFNNRVLDADPPIDAPVFDTDGTTRLEGRAFLAQLYAGPTEASLVPVGHPVTFLSGDDAGYFDTSQHPAGAVRAIPRVLPGEVAYAQVRVWELAAGYSYPHAVAFGGKHGASAVLSITTGGAGDPPSPPANLAGLTSFQLVQDPPRAPEITRQPESQIVPLGAKVVFKVGAVGTFPLRYQWRFNGEDLAGRTSPVLALHPVSAEHAGTYDVVVRNAAGSVTSDPATLEVRLMPPTIVGQPRSLTVVAGGHAAFQVHAHGTPPLRFQWQFNGTDVPNATNPVLWLKSVAATDAGEYAVVVRNPYGSVTSSNATLTVREPEPVEPVIVIQPRSQTVPAGGHVAFTVYAKGSRPLSYQWLFNGEAVEHGTNAVLWLRNVQPADAGEYTVTVSNPAGSVTSAGATLTVVVPPPPPQHPPVIVMQPRSLVVLEGGKAAFHVGVQGTPPLTFQWRLNGTDLTGKTEPVLVIERVAPSDAGTYDVVVSNPAGSVTSAPATLTVTNPPPPPPPPPPHAPIITVQPRNQVAPVGAHVAFGVGVKGTPPLRFQWRFNGVDIEGATGPALWVRNVQPEQAGRYDVVVSNEAGSVTSAPATLTVHTPPPPPPPPTNHPPVILMQPQSQIVPAGANVAFHVAVKGTPPFRFQWRVNGAPIEHGTNATLALANVQPGQAGAYDVVVSNEAGSVTSAPATLTVHTPPPPQPPVIVRQPVSQTVREGTPVGFHVQATGSGPLQFQWRFSGADLPHATSPNLYLGPVTPAQAGNYNCVVRNPAGAVTSETATLTVTNAVP